MSAKTSNNARGFSFIEVLITIVVFAFLVVGVLLMTTMNIKSNSYSQHHTKAVQLAESGLEFLRRVDYNTELPLYDGVSSDSISEYGTIPNYLEYRRVLLVTWDDEVSVLQVAVTWRNLGANSIPIVLTTQRVAP